jgi:hypothetical protein
MRLIVMAAALALMASVAAAATLNVHIDGSARFRIPAGARNVMVGNPSIADVNILDSNNIAVLGRTYGATGILITDAHGRTLLDGTIVVSPPETGQISFVGGTVQANYSCSPRCERVAMPGEPQISYEQYANPYQGYSSRVDKGRSTGANPEP